MFNIKRHLKFIMARCQLGNSDTDVYHKLYKGHTYDDLICLLCRTAQENVIHFVMLPCAKCFNSTRIRSAIIPQIPQSCFPT